jgi:hypothetical protein
VPQDPGFIELALRHRYSLRHLSTAELPFCELGSYLGKVRGEGRTMPAWSEQLDRHLQLAPRITGCSLQNCLPVLIIRKVIRTQVELRFNMSAGAWQPDVAGCDSVHTVPAPIRLASAIKRHVHGRRPAGHLQPARSVLPSEFIQ